MIPPQPYPGRPAPPPRPLPARRRKEYSARMTIAAGLVNDSGVLLCADTLVGDGELSAFRSKLTGGRFSDGSIIFGVADDLAFCDSFTQKCITNLKKYGGTPRSSQQIVGFIQNAWMKAWKESVVTETSWPQVIIALWSSAENDTRLYVSGRDIIAESKAGVECIGCGCAICKYFLGSHPLCGRTSLLQEVFQQTISACAHSKAAMPTAIGGNLTAVNLSRSGDALFYGHILTARVEAYTLELHAEALEFERDVLREMDNGSAIAEAWTRHAERVERIRELWQIDPMKAWGGSVPQEASDLWNAFKKSAPKDLQSTTTEPSPPPPLQG